VKQWKAIKNLEAIQNNQKPASKWPETKNKKPS